MWNLNTPSFLRLAATHLRRFSLLSVDKPLRALAAEKRSLLGHLEECIDTVLVSPCVSVSKKETQTVLYILHRLLDHGVARKLVVQAQCPVILAWLLRERGPQPLESLRSGTRASGQAEETQDLPAKRPKLGSGALSEEAPEAAQPALDPQRLCRLFPCGGGAPAGPCPRGRVEQLEVSQCGPDCLSVLSAALPTFSCLRSLGLHSFGASESRKVIRQRVEHAHARAH